MDLGDCNVKLCHSLGSPDDCPHWRRVPGFPVFGVGQPSEQGFYKIAENVPKEKTLWFNMRQEPCAYIKGVPCTPRKSNDPHDNIKIGGKTADMDAMEVKFVKELEARATDGLIEIHKDKDEAENPLDREEIKDSVKLEELKGFNTILKSLAEGAMKDMTVVRVPIEEERALPEECFDVIVKALVGTIPSKTQCVFSSQLGKGRTTTGMVIACIVKAVQMITDLQSLVEKGVAKQDWANGIIFKTFEELADSEDLKDPMLMGEFLVIKELLEKYPEFKTGKILADKMIDICGVPPEGTGIQNIRKCAIETKYKYDAATEDRQYIWKNMIINFIERYFYMICFGTYARDHAASGFQKTFAQWMDEHSSLREMIKNGKDKMEWSRQVDQVKVDNLRSKVSGPDYKEKLGEVLTNLYKMSHETYHDMPRGTIKDTLMRKLTCKTLMDILPSDVSSGVQKELVEKKMTVDLDTVITLVVSRA